MRPRRKNRHENVCNRLSYVQRGDPPTAFARVLATRYGMQAAKLAVAAQWGQMAALRGNTRTSCSLTETTTGIKELDPEIYRTAEIIFG